jgi:hypothetical protein
LPLQIFMQVSANKCSGPLQGGASNLQ